MTTTKKIQRLIFENDIQKCWCSKHQEYFPCSEFSPSSDNHGYQYYCRDCAFKIKTGEYEPLVPEYVREGANNLLKGLGYVLDSELSVHQQFLKKHSINDTI